MFIVQAHATLFRDLLSVMYNVKSTSSTADVPLSCRFAGGGMKLLIGVIEVCDRAFENAMLFKTFQGIFLPLSFPSCGASLDTRNIRKRRGLDMKMTD